MEQKNNKRSLEKFLLPTKPYWGILIIGLIILGSSCKRRIPESYRPQAMELYSKSVKLLKLYSDSFAISPDSMTLLELNHRFMHSFTALNFKYPSETCLEISEGENDTLTNLTERLVAIRDSMLYVYAHPAIENADSISNDSITKI